MSKSFTRVLILITAFALTGLQSSAVTYTAVANGNFNTGSTWQGGIAPPYNLTDDVVIIPGGFTVALTGNLVMGGAVGSLNVNGTLSGSTHSLVINDLQFTGTGEVNVDSFAGGTSVFGTFDFGGTLNTNILHTQFMNSANSPIINVAQKLYLSDTMHMTSGTFTIGSGSDIIVTNSGSTLAGPYLLVSGTGNYNLTNAYAVDYAGGSVRAGTELSGSGLSAVNVNVGTGNEVQLTDDLVLNTQTLMLSDGVLNLNNQNLTIGNSNGITVSGTAAIRSTSASDLTINADINSALRFAQGSALGNLNINVNNAVRLGTDLKVATAVNLNSGKVHIQGYKLSLITGAVVNNAGTNKYIIADAGGQLVADIAPNSSTMYHVGTAHNYAPCTITANTNTAYNGIGAGVNSGVKAAGTTGKLISANQPLVNATWFISPGNASVVDVDIKLAWDAGIELNGFDRQSAYVAQLAGATWKKNKAGQATQEPNGQYSYTQEEVHYFSPLAVFDGNTVGVEQLATADDIKIYPNPASNVLHIRTPQQAAAVIYDMQGRSASNLQLQQGDNATDISMLPAGVYYMQLSTGASIKFIKQ